MNKELSAIIIVKNDADTLDECLSTFQACVREIVVVDMGSIDNSFNIARKYTNKVNSYNGDTDNISDAINIAMNYCSYGYAIWATGDEYLLPNDRKVISNLSFEDKKVIICQICEEIDEMGEPKYITPEVRIVDLSLNLKYSSKIIPRLIYTEEAFFSNINIIRIVNKIKILDRIKSLKKEIHNDGINNRSNFYIGEYYLRIENTKSSITYLTNYLEGLDLPWRLKFRANYLLSSIYLKSNEILFKDYFHRALNVSDQHAELYYLMGSFWESKKEFERASQWYGFCTHISIPKKLLCTFEPRYYTWLPRLQLCVCCNNLNLLDEAYKWNTDALSYRPNDETLLKNKKIFEEHFRYGKPKEKKDGKGKKINLGCGNKTEDGYVNVDIFKGPAVDEIFEFDDIPYLDGTISAIFSEHALEHVGWKRADRALSEWYRVLSTGGELRLKMPEFEDCCRKYIESPPDKKDHRLWYKYTIYGIQDSQAGEPDEAQYHMFGWSILEMCEKLEGLGFKIKRAEKYNGFDTPSMDILAIKI